jgi:hypothetical protein
MEVGVVEGEVLTLCSWREWLEVGKHMVYSEQQSGATESVL